MTRRSYLALPLAAFGQGAGRIFPDWDRATADRLLTESPWAQAIDAPLRDRAYKSELYLTVRWASALPVRQANAYLLGLESRAAKLLLASTPSHYLIEIAGFPAGTLREGGTKGLEKELLASARLTSKTHPPLAPTSVAVPEFGSHMMAELRFPRQPAFTLEDGSVELSALVLRGRVNIRAKFPLKAMVYQGQLEL